MFDRTKYTTRVLSLAVAAFVVAGCDSGGSSKSGGGGKDEEQSAESHHHDDEGHHEGSHGEGHHHDDEEGHHHEGDDHHEGEEQAAEGSGETVDVPADGKKFEPSVAAEQMPDGAWHCNMKGKVHYAAMEKGDGECPVCGMDLVEK